MNCRQGELAYIVAPDYAPYDRKFVTCVRVFGAHPDIPEYGICWEVRAEGWTPPCTVRLRDGLFGFPDSLLRPIRNPGADEVDEMVKRVGPAPMTLTELLRGEETAHG